ncbi:hypothetical protein RIF29_37618 [Crotalaria pallida]|uniref:Uncharacterized protein n=1 Tax=Crotalaria pallida TaxID=3830 RepID=A0AAN9HWF0_CROPI
MLLVTEYFELLVMDACCGDAGIDSESGNQTCPKCITTKDKSKSITIYVACECDRYRTTKLPLSLPCSAVQCRDLSIIAIRSSSIPEEKETMSRRDIPEDCWEAVLRRVVVSEDKDEDEDEDEVNVVFEPLSLVSKQFLSLTNRLRSSLPIRTTSTDTKIILPPLLSRFPNLTSLDLSIHHSRSSSALRRRDSHALLSYIFHHCSALPLIYLNISGHQKLPFDQPIPKMQTLKSLICSHFGPLPDSDLAHIPRCFPMLQELDFSNPTVPGLSADALCSLALGLPMLNKVDLSCNPCITDSSLIYLFKHCHLLQHVTILGFSSLTPLGIASAIFERPRLTSLSFSPCPLKQQPPLLPLLHSMLSLKSLACIHFSHVSVPDQFLSSIADQGLPLTKLSLAACYSYTYDGIFCLLSKCQLIQHLNLTGARFLQDNHVTQLSMFLTHLVFINLTFCKQLTNLSFVTLATKCPSLTHINMGFTSIGEEGNEKKEDRCSMDCVAKNSQVKSLYLGSNPMLTDQTIKMFASICPNLELLDLNNIHLRTACSRDLSKGVVEVLKTCPKMRHLILAHHSDLKLFGMNFQVPRLEVLDLSGSGIDDSSLLIIARRSCGLLRLNLTNCSNITTKGVRRAIKKCRILREINLLSCHNVAAGVIAWMVYARPSLRRIVAPRHFRLSEIQKEDERFKIVEFLYMSLPRQQPPW